MLAILLRVLYAEFRTVDIIVDIIFQRIRGFAFMRYINLLLTLTLTLLIYSTPVNV